MRTSKVIGFSVPPLVENQINSHLKATGKTRSEFMREMIGDYFNERKNAEHVKPPAQSFSDHDINSILKLYHELIGMNTKDILVIGLAIIQKEGKILIGCRKEKDLTVKDLSWVFPGGKMKSLDFRTQLRDEVAQETGLHVNVLDIIHARLIPDSPEKKFRIIALYFNCGVTGGKEEPGGDLDKLQWVNPTTVCRYFTTSTADEVMEFLGRIGREVTSFHEGTSPSQP